MFVYVLVCICVWAAHPIVEQGAEDDAGAQGCDDGEHPHTGGE